MTVSADEFLRRFLIHVLPKGLVRIRHFGLFANRRRAASLLRCRALLGPPSSSPQLTSTSQLRCPSCSAPMLILERMTSSQLHFRLPLTLHSAPQLASTAPDLTMIRTASINVACKRARTRKVEPCPFASLGFNMGQHRLPMNIDIPHRRRHARPLSACLTPAQRPPNRFQPIQIP